MMIEVPQDVEFFFFAHKREKYGILSMNYEVQKSIKEVDF